MHVVYILDVFPKISETFIIEEIVEVLRNGIDIRIITLRRTKTDKVSDKYIKYKLYQKTTCVGDINYDLRSIIGLISKKSIFQKLVKGYEDIYYMGKIFKIVSALQIKEVSLIHAHYGNQPAYIASTVAEILNIPFTFTTHAHDIYGRHANNRYLKVALERCSKAITISNYNKNNLLKIVNNSTKIEVINCGVDLDDFSPQRTQTEEFRILTVSRLVEKKGIKDVIIALNHLKKRNLNFKYNVVGEGPEKERLERLIENLNLKNHVSLIGNITDEELRAQYNKASIFILPAKIAKDGDRDGIPIVLMEAMAMKLPVISTTVSGIPELINEDCGILVKPSDDKGLAEAIEQLYRQPDICIKMGENGRRRIEEHFNAKKNYCMLAETFKEIVKNGKDDSDVSG